MDIAVKLQEMTNEGYLLLQDGKLIHQKAMTGRNLDINTYTLIEFIGENESEITLNYKDIKDCNVDRTKLISSPPPQTGRYKGQTDVPPRKTF